MVRANGDVLRVELVESLDTLKRYAIQYDALTERMDGTCFPVYQRFWIEKGAPIYLADNRSLFLLFAWRDDDLIGVAPFQMIQRFFGPEP